MMRSESVVIRRVMCGLPITGEESDHLSKDIEVSATKDSCLMNWMIVLSLLVIVLAIVGKEFV